MSNISSIMDRQLKIEASLKQRMLDFEKTAEQLKASIPDSASVECLTKEFSEFKAYVQDMFLLLKNQIAEIGLDIDNIEMRHRRKFLLLSGVPESNNEDEVGVISSILCKSLKFDTLSARSFLAVYRLGKESSGRSRPLLFRLVDPGLRAEIWRKKTLLKGTPYVLSEFLTRRRRFLLTEARQHFHIGNVWSNNGVINVKLPDGSRKRLDSKEQLDQLIAVHSCVNTMSSSAESDLKAPSSQSSSIASSTQSRVKRTKKK